MAQNEGLIVLAIDAFHKGHFSTLRAACTSYGAPYSTVRDRVEGAIPRRDFKPKNKKLADLEKAAIVQ